MGVSAGCCVCLFSACGGEGSSSDGSGSGAQGAGASTSAGGSTSAGAAGGSAGAGASASGGTSSGGTGGKPDPSLPPAATVVFPPFDVGIGAESITVRGRVTAGDVASVSINGTDAELVSDGGLVVGFRAKVPLQGGANSLSIELVPATGEAVSLTETPEVIRYDGSASDEIPHQSDMSLIMFALRYDRVNQRFIGTDDIGDGLFELDPKAGTSRFLLYTENGARQTGSFDGGRGVGVEPQIVAPRVMTLAADGSAAFGRDAARLYHVALPAPQAGSEATGSWMAADDVHDNDPIQAGSGAAWSGEASGIALDDDNGRLLVLTTLGGEEVIMAVDTTTFERSVVVSQSEASAWPGTRSRASWSPASGTLYISGVYSSSIFALDLANKAGSYLVASDPLGGDQGGTQYIVQLAADDAHDRVVAWVEDPATLIGVSPSGDVSELSSSAQGHGEVPIAPNDLEATDEWIALLDIDCQSDACRAGTGPGAYRLFIVDAESGDRAVAAVWSKFQF